MGAYRRQPWGRHRCIMGPMPNLKTLRFTGLPNMRAIMFVVKNMLEHVQVELAPEDYEDFGLPESFVSKIRSWTYYSADKFYTVADNFSCFSPVEILINPRRYPEDVLEHGLHLLAEWGLLTRLPALEILELDFLDSLKMCTALPPALKKLTVSNFSLTLPKESDLAILRDLTASKGSSFQFSLTHYTYIFPSKRFNPDELRLYLAELAFWRTVDSFTFRLISPREETERLLADFSKSEME